MKVRYRYVTYGAGRPVIDQMQQMHQLMHHLLARATPGASGAWQPATDVYETADAVVVRIELAGVREDDIDITLFADHLAVAGTRENAALTGAAYHQAGILYGPFRIEAPLTARVQRDHVEATFENGMLTIVLPKATERIETTRIQPTMARPQEETEIQ